MYRMGAIGVVVATCLAGGAARADQWTVPSVPWLLGDWGGLRTRIYQQGIDFQFGYANEFATNTQGGVKRWAGYADQSTAGATLNLERLFGVKDAIFQISYTERTGRNLVTDAQLNTLQLVQEVYGRGQTARLTQFWYDQHYLDDFISLKAGRMPVGGDFAAFTCDFQNLTFCGANIGNLVGNYIFNWPISQWATRIKFNFNGFGYFQLGAYDQNQQYLGYTEALAPVFYKDSSGVLLPAEVAWLPLHRAVQLAAQRQHCVRVGHDPCEQSHRHGGDVAEHIEHDRTRADSTLRICLRAVLHVCSDARAVFPAELPDRAVSWWNQPQQKCRCARPKNSCQFLNGLIRARADPGSWPAQNSWQQRDRSGSRAGRTRGRHRRSQRR